MADGHKRFKHCIVSLGPFFNTFGLGEEKVELHCDNCSGQNKNNYVIKSVRVSWICTLLSMILFDLYNLTYFLNFIVIFVDTCFGIYVGALQRDGMQKLGSTSWLRTTQSLHPMGVLGSSKRHTRGMIAPL